MGCVKEHNPHKPSKDPLCQSVCFSSNQYHITVHHKDLWQYVPDTLASIFYLVEMQTSEPFCFLPVQSFDILDF